MQGHLYKLFTVATLVHTTFVRKTVAFYVAATFHFSTSRSHLLAALGAFLDGVTHGFLFLRAHQVISITVISVEFTVTELA